MWCVFDMLRCNTVAVAEETAVNELCYPRISRQKTADSEGRGVHPASHTTYILSTALAI